MIEIKDKRFVPYIGKDELESIVARLAREVSRDYADGNLVLCPVLTGAYMFAADLARQLTVPAEVHFVRYNSYSGMQSTGTVNCSLPFPDDIKGRDVLVVEDVVDSGLSMDHVLEEARKKEPRSVKLCTLLFKPGCFKGHYRVDYIGREIGDDFIVGYGMDYDEQGRTLGEIYSVMNDE